MTEESKKRTKNNILKLVISPVRYLLLKFLWEPAYWKKRVNDVLTCPDIKFIPVVEGAGKVKNGHLIMHNGLKIDPLSYYGSVMLKMFKKSKGIHEPQEERIFLEVLKILPEKALMLELGSYWSFYSMCFNKEVQKAKNFLVEPTAKGLAYGERNFALNNMAGDFSRAYIGKTSGTANDGVPIVCIDDFMNHKNIHFIDILHADIQEFEGEMLEGGKNALTNRKVGYIFISTHSNSLHDKCIEILKSFDYVILQSINLNETYSLDGLIVAVAPNYTQIKNIVLSKKEEIVLK